MCLAATRPAKINVTFFISFTSSFFDLVYLLLESTPHAKKSSRHDQRDADLGEAEWICCCISAAADAA